MIHKAIRLASLASLLFVLPLAFSLSPQGAAARDQKSVRVGTSWVIELKGNPSTGYKWRLNEGSSENLAIVKVEDLGYGESSGSSKKGHVMVGAPAPYRFRITGLSAGFAKLHFEYVRPWVGSPTKTEDVWVHIE
jgi:predicted secreted protein